MYNMNYGDGRGYPPWSKQQSHASNQQPQPPSAAQLSTTPRPRPSQKSPEVASERVWVDTRSGDEATMHHLPAFKSSASGKSHLSPPLDLSENRRQVESPLDLSVKTRKRCADTTEYAEHVARLGLVHEGFMPKRLCQTRDYAYPQGHPNFQQESFHDKSFASDSTERSKMIQQRQIAMNKYSSSQLKPQSSPKSLPQTHYPLDIQRQQQPSHPTRQQLPVPQSPKHSSVRYGISPQHTQTLHSTLPKTHPHPSYDNMPGSVKRSPQTNMTESVALKGFFEPTQKVTVNASSVSQPQVPVPVPQQSHFQRVAQDPLVAGHTVRQVQGSATNEMQEFDGARRQQLAFHASNTSAYARRLQPSGSGFTNTTSERDLMQSKQSQYERHLQQQHHLHQLAPKSQREQMLLMAQRNQKQMNPKAVQEQKMAYLLEMQSQSEARANMAPVGSSAIHSSRSQFLSYTQPRQSVTATATYQDSLRKEKSDFQAARCSRVTQPVTLSDIQQEQALVLEHVHSVQIRPEMYGQQTVNEINKFNQRIPDQMHASPTAMSQPRLQQNMRYEQSRYGVNPVGKEVIEGSLSYMDRNDPSNVNTLNLHPSVIQRPQGYIPPRIVRGSGIASDGRAQRRSIDIQKEHAQMSRFELLQSENQRSRVDVAHHGRAVYAPKPADMLSGKEVMKIQQRVAEQRGESQNASITSGKSGLARLGVGRDHERKSSFSSGSTAHKSSSRRKSSSEHHSRDMPSQEQLQPRKIETSVDAPIVVAETESNSAEPRFEGSGKLPQKVVCSSPCSTGRSITKGTSGITKLSGDMDPFSQFLMRELKKTDDDNSVNPFANRSLLQEFDRSANSSPVRAVSVAQSEKSEKSNISVDNDVEIHNEISTQTTSIQENPSYTLPLQIAIPGNKLGTQSTTVSSSTSTVSSVSSVTMTSTSQTTMSSLRSSVIAGSVKTESSSKNPKLMSRKHMILSAFRMEEDLKNTNSVDTVNIDMDEKVPMESAKFAARKSERDQNVTYPPSPKMPILSPQERNRSSSAAGPAVTEPPNLEESSASNSGKDCSKKEINSLEEHLHRLISDAVKGSKNKDKESVYETVRRELSTQPQVNKVFLSRQLSQTRNIPVANVAPIVHGKSVSDTLEGSDKNDSNGYKDDLDEGDAKMADIVTRSLFGNQALLLKDTKPETNDDGNVSQTQFEQDVDRSDSNLSVTSVKEEPLFDENSNSKRMSPGLKKLMLYRHRDGSGNSKDSEDVMNKTSESVLKNENEISCNSSDINCDKSKSRRNRSASKTRNVFGAFSEIVAQHSSLDKTKGGEPVDNVVNTEEGVESCWTGYQPQDSDEHDIHMVFNTDYDGDDEQVKDIHVLRWNKPSNTKQHADRLIRKARHRRNSKQEASANRRRKENPLKPTSSPPRKHSKRSLSHENNSESTAQKLRQRRASSLDRETKSKKSKLKSKHACFSDNELDSDSVVKRSNVAGDNSVESDATWHNEDESTDEEYFQNYEDEFKQLAHKAEKFKFKKTSTVKKRKGFHFKQTYIFQRKRKSNRGRGRGGDQHQHQLQHVRAGPGLDSIYSFHDEGNDVGNLRGVCPSLLSTNYIPVPADLRRVTVNKDSGQTMLHRAVRMGLEEVVLYCLATGSVDVNARDNAGYTALHECAVRGRVQIGKHLLTYGADVNCCSTEGGIRPIHDAVENDHLEMFRLLISYGADPTLSTYAGRSLMKIARTERMVRFLQRYLSDLNGYATDEDERPWKFRHSSNLLAPESGSGCAIFDNLPSDPEDESHDMFSFSSKPVFSTRRLASEPSKRVEDFLLLEDILQAYGISRYDLQAHGISHFIKKLPIQTLIDSHHDSIYLEYLQQKNDCKTIEVIRKVDSTQIISKLEKISSVHKKKPKLKDNL